jgi:hypothetical protein
MPGCNEQRIEQYDSRWAAPVCKSQLREADQFQATTSSDWNGWGASCSVLTICRTGVLSGTIAATWVRVTNSVEARASIQSQSDVRGCNDGSSWQRRSRLHRTEGPSRRGAAPRRRVEKARARAPAFRPGSALSRVCTSAAGGRARHGWDAAPDWQGGTGRHSRTALNGPRPGSAGDSERESHGVCVPVCGPAPGAGGPAGASASLTAALGPGPGVPASRSPVPPFPGAGGEGRPSFMRSMDHL